MRPFMPVLVLPLMAPAVLAAPWQTGTMDPEDPTYLAYQLDPENESILIVDCYHFLGSPGIWVLANKAWEQTTSYAPEVEPEFAVDGIEIVAPKFHYYDYQGREGIFAGPLSELEAFSSLYSAIFYAEQSITISYFDKRATFSAEGAAEAITSVEEACGFEATAQY